MGLRALLCGLFLGLLLSACATAPDAGSGEPWVVGSDLDNTPFIWVDNTGEPRGRDVVMAQVLADGLGRPLVWKRMPFRDLLAALEAGEIDSAISTMGYTPERAQRVLMSEPYYVTALRALVRKGAGEPKEVADLIGKAFSVGEGTTSERAVQGYAGSVLADPSPIGRAAPERLRKREVDAAIMDGPIAYDYAVANPDLRVLETPVATEAYVIAVRPDRPELRDAIDEILRGMRSEGLLERLDELFGVPPSESHGVE